MTTASNEVPPLAWLAGDRDRKHTWASVNAGGLAPRPVAYFSMEYGLHEKVAIYSGGLGVLAGDHLKSASGLGLPLVAIGLLYGEGYFSQSLDAEGKQIESYEPNDPSAWGAKRVVDDKGNPLTVSVPLAGRSLGVGAWRLDVGSVPLYLLDTDLSANPPDDRALTRRLYSGGTQTRIQQEILLGVGGVRLLAKLGIEPAVLHLNEGHCAFAPVERIALRAQREGLSLGRAVARVREQTVFTTHTPVPAGHDRFVESQVREECADWAAESGFELDWLMKLGYEPEGEGESIVPREDINAPAAQENAEAAAAADAPPQKLCMTVLALNLSSKANGVSALHGIVSREMWKDLFPEVPEHRVPIGHITNGVHIGTWMSEEMKMLLDRRVGTGWRHEPWSPAAWAGIENVPMSELQQVRGVLRDKLVRFVRIRAAQQAEARGESTEVVAAMRAAIPENALVVGFARRFATYKRATLLLEDEAWLESLVGDPDRPIVFVFAGKAHPRDQAGKDFVQAVFQATRKPSLVGKVIFIADYDMEVGRQLTQGADVWLNNPRRPHEASGTSGQKVVYNAGLNCSILDGWWAEGYDGGNGFAIGDAFAQATQELQDEADADALRATLTEVRDLFHGDPQKWYMRVRRSMTTLSWRFNATRMVRDYALGAYLPAAGLELAESR